MNMHSDKKLNKVLGSGEGQCGSTIMPQPLPYTGPV